MAIQPNTDIRLLTGIPLDNTYNHTVYFTDNNAQASYFISKTKHNFAKQTYQRVSSGVCRVATKPDKCYDCNYMMFKNTNYGNKWFYAFVTNVNYINDNTAEVHYEIDVMQTWAFDYTRKRCYVEREHVMDDTKWLNLVGEPYPLGDTVYSNMQYLGTGSWDMDYIVYSAYTIGEGTKTNGSKANGNIYGSALYLATSLSELSDIIKKLQAIADDAIQLIQGCPKIFTSKLPTTVANKIGNGDYVTEVIDNLELSHNNIGGYKPRNNKCFNYPYYCLYVSNQQGGNTTMDFAKFLNPITIQYTIYGDICANNSPILHFNDYSGLGNKHDYDLQCGQSPQASWQSNNYIAFAQQQSRAKLNAFMSNVIGYNTGFGDKTSVGKLETTGNLATNLFDTMTSLSYAKAQQHNNPPTVHNLTGNSNLTSMINAIRPVAGIRHMQVELIKRLDDFFDVYGYQVNKLKKPNISGRPVYNYVKTAGFVMTGSVPTPDANKICSIYDNGITFWRNPSQVGDYNLNNRGGVTS